MGCCCCSPLSCTGYGPEFPRQVLMVPASAKTTAVFCSRCWTKSAQKRKVCLSMLLGLIVNTRFKTQPFQRHKLLRNLRMCFKLNSCCLFTINLNAKTNKVLQCVPELLPSGSYFLAKSCSLYNELLQFICLCTKHTFCVLF